MALTMKIGCFIIATLLAQLNAMALSYSTAREAISVSVSTALNQYQEEHPDAPMPTLSDLGNGYLDLDKIGDTLGVAATNAFVVIAGDHFPIPAPGSGDVVVLMTTVSLDARHGSEPVRNVIIRDAKGVFHARSVDEAALEAEAAKAGLVLPQHGIIKEDIPQYILDWGKPSSQTNATATVDEAAMKNGSSGVEESDAAQGRAEPQQAFRFAPTNALLATGTPPPSPPRWWLPVAVFGGLGVIGFLLFRARRRVDAPER